MASNLQLGNSDTPSGASSNAQARDFIDVDALNDQIYRCVPIAEGWPTMAEAVRPREDEGEDRLEIDPEFDRENIRFQESRFASTTSVEQSSFDDTDEVCHCLYLYKQMSISFYYSSTILPTVSVATSMITWRECSWRTRTSGSFILSPTWATTMAPLSQATTTPSTQPRRTPSQPSLTCRTRRRRPGTSLFRKQMLPGHTIKTHDASSTKPCL